MVFFQSLKFKLLLVAGAVTLVVMFGLMPVLHGAFDRSLEHSIRHKLAADVRSIASLVSFKDGTFSLPKIVSEEAFDELEFLHQSYILDASRALIWQSDGALQANDIADKIEKAGASFRREKDSDGHEYFLYEKTVSRLGNVEGVFTIVAVQPMREYQYLHDAFLRCMYLWLGVAMLVLFALLGLGGALAFNSMRKLSLELDEIESGKHKLLSNDYPVEILRLTSSLNRLLEQERYQCQRYKHSLDNLAHSIKTPLAVLQSIAEKSTWLKNVEDGKEIQRQIALVDERVGYQLQHALIRHGALVKHNSSLSNVVDILTGVLDKVWGKNVIVDHRFDPDMSVPLERGALIELLGNLLDNSYRFCVGRVRIAATNNGTLCELIIEDDGPGIPVHQRERIMNRGERLDTQHPGQGIGTAVVSDIVAGVGGKIVLGDSEWGGAKFTIQLPSH